MIRLVGLSATLPNFEDVAAFLRVDPAQVGTLWVWRRQGLWAVEQASSHSLGYCVHHHSDLLDRIATACSFKFS